jgi:hypothetical protein
MDNRDGSRGPLAPGSGPLGRLLEEQTALTAAMKLLGFKPPLQMVTMIRSPV